MAISGIKKTKDTESFKKTRLQVKGLEQTMQKNMLSQFFFTDIKLFPVEK